MNKTKKIIIAVIVIALIAVVAYYYWYKPKYTAIPAKGKTASPSQTPVSITSTNPGGRSAASSVPPQTIPSITPGVDKWVVVGKPNDWGHCPMGQAKIWDGQNWVCCVSDK